MIFVTGGTGMVGAHMLLELVRKGVKVKALRRSSSNLDLTRKIFSFYESNVDQLFNQIEWVEGDLLDYNSLKNILSDVELVYHAAATVSFQAQDRNMMLENNVDGTANLINASLECGVKRFCHVSSVAALGRNENGDPVKEDTMWVPEKRQSNYSESKFFSEMEVWRGIHEGMDAVIVNPGIILGPGNWQSGSPLFFTTVWNGLKYYTRGGTGYVDVRDVVKGMLLLTDDLYWEDVKNKRYVLCAENHTYQEIFSSIADALGKPRPSVFANERLLNIGWRLAALKAFLTRTRPVITKETIRSASNISTYSGKRISDSLSAFSYTPIENTIKDIAGIFLKDHTA
ncbi:MAG: NAD-dependent epimerase/dehydratase family protein [Bacteroidota bacterium]|nr:NAD-dependent epimerase/dehydratase family protein [Bacteroidota bacterium]